MTGQFHAPAALSPKKRQIPTDWRLGGLQSQSDLMLWRTDKSCAHVRYRTPRRPARSLSPHACNVFCPSGFDRPSNVQWTVQIIQLLILLFSPPSCHFLPPSSTHPHTHTPHTHTHTPTHTPQHTPTLTHSVCKTFWGSYDGEISTKFFWDVTTWSLADSTDVSEQLAASICKLRNWVSRGKWWIWGTDNRLAQRHSGPRGGRYKDHSE